MRGAGKVRQELDGAAGKVKAHVVLAFLADCQLPAAQQSGVGKAARCID